MRKLVAAMNMTLDGFCDHTAMITDDEVHEQHYTELLRGADLLLYGRVTYQLMEYWRGIVANPTGNKATDGFAHAIDNCPKIVYSRTLESADWKGTELQREIDADEIRELKRSSGKDILVGSPSMIVAFLKLKLVDELQLAIQPAIVGSGLQLFNDIKDRIDLNLLKTKAFGSGAVVHYYEPKTR